MQFTGLTDKNGKEIYEGDILKDSWECVHEVYYSEDAQWSTHLHKHPKHIFPARYLHCAYMQWEVIGNIYENPELLK